MKSMNRKEGKKIAVMMAVVMGFMVIAFLPMADATVTSFTVTPGTGLAGAVDSYTALVTTDGVTTINITIPAGFIAVTPATGGVQIARVDFWNSSTKAYYGYATITSNNANPTTKVDVYCKLRVGGDEVNKTSTENIDYTAGAINVFESGFDCDHSSATLTLPTEDDDGCINISINCTDCPCFSENWRLDDVSINIGQFVRNPAVAKVYDFYAEGEVAHVNIHYQPLGDIAYLKQGAGGATDYGLYIYTAPSTIRQHGTLTASDYWSPDGSTVAVTAIDIDGNGVDEIAYLKQGAGGDTDYGLYIYTAPTAIGEHGTLIASDYWSPDGNTVAITAVGGGDQIAYLKQGPGGGTDYDLFIYTAPTAIGEHGTLIASDYWSPDGNTVAITAVGGGDQIAYLKKGPYGAEDYDLYIYTAPTIIRQHGTLIAADYWSPDGNSVAITAIDMDGVDEIAYLKKGPGGATDYDLYIYTAVTHGTLTASDLWSPDGQTEGISALP
jgi:hypothetical protein